MDLLKKVNVNKIKYKFIQGFYINNKSHLENFKIVYWNSEYKYK